MKKNAEKRIVRQEDSKQLVLSIARSMHEVLHELVVGAGVMRRRSCKDAAPAASGKIRAMSHRRRGIVTAGSGRPH